MKTIHILEVGQGIRPQQSTRKSFAIKKSRNTVSLELEFMFLFYFQPA